MATAACTQKTQLRADSVDAPKQVAAPAVDTSLVMSLERGPCRGRCPVYRVDVYADGKVRFDGKQHVASIGIQSGNTPASSVQELLRAIQSSAFSSVDTSFVMGSAACGQYMPDLPWSRLSAKLSTGMKSVQHDPGCRNAPRYLRKLEAQIDSVARTAQWIAGNGDAGK
ncbi:MAG: hypothetical protein H7Z40_11840 [Phycisphaerae bacterium]|nr:hypothetical protein [Gemmatimonadaceae bacterium]